VSDYDLFVDESGRFLEHLADTSKRIKQKFKSQIVGVLAPRKRLDESSATLALSSALNEAGKSYPICKSSYGSPLLHAAEHLRIPQDVSKDQYRRLISTLIEKCRNNNWRPVRIVNTEAVSFETREETYLQLLAELVDRVLSRLADEGVLQPRIFLIAGGIRLSNGTYLENKDLIRQIRVRVEWLMARRLSVRKFELAVADVRTGNDKIRPELQLCDVLSDASRHNYKKGGAFTRLAFKNYDFRGKALRFVEAELDELLLVGDLGGAAKMLLEVLDPSTHWYDEKCKEQASNYKPKMVTALAAADASTRNLHLQMLSAWLEQLVDGSRQIPVAQAILIESINIADAIRGQVNRGVDKGTSDWFSYAVRVWSLTASNHAGDIDAARITANEMNSMLESLVGDWERIPLLLRGFIAQSVHFTDCFEAEKAVEEMKKLVDLQQSLTEGFSHLKLPQRIQLRSDVLARVLGTLVQAQIAAGLSAPQHLADARITAERAYNEFPGYTDRQRQLQIRSYLEAASGDIPSARTYLAQAFGISINDVKGISSQECWCLLGRKVKEWLGSEHLSRQLFPIFHFLRLGEYAIRTDSELREEGREFIDVCKETGVLDLDLTLSFSDYPIHGILRRTAFIQTCNGDTAKATKTWKKLYQIIAGCSSPVLMTIGLATWLEMAGWGAVKDKSFSREFQGKTKNDFWELLQSYRGAIPDQCPGFERVIQGWQETAEALVKENHTEKTDLDKVLALTRLISY
jgi:hypothetical protein